jgi:hypothetical protein
MAGGYARPTTLRCITWFQVTAKAFAATVRISKPTVKTPIGPVSTFWPFRTTKKRPERLIPQPMPMSRRRGPRYRRKHLPRGFQSPIRKQQLGSSPDVNQAFNQSTAELTRSRLSSLPSSMTRPVGEIKSRALKTLKLQTEIVRSFLGSEKPNGQGNGNSNARPNRNSNNDREANGVIAARMLDVGIAKTAYGERVYVKFDVNGRWARSRGCRSTSLLPSSTASTTSLGQGMRQEHGSLAR